MNSRFLGLICMVGSATMALDAMRMAAGLKTAPSGDFDTINLVTGILWGIGAMAGIIGMIRLNVLGSNPVVRSLGLVPVIGFGLLIVANIIQLAGIVTTQNNMLAGIGWLVELSGMVLAGILVIAAKSWLGWKRFLPLLTVVAVPISFGLGSLLGTPDAALILCYGLWILLGYVVMVDQPGPARQNLATA